MMKICHWCHDQHSREGNFCTKYHSVQSTEFDRRFNSNIHGVRDAALDIQMVWDSAEELL